MDLTAVASAAEALFSTLTPLSAEKLAKANDQLANELNSSGRCDAHIESSKERAKASQQELKESKEAFVQTFEGGALVSEPDCIAALLATFKDKRAEIQARDPFSIARQNYELKIKDELEAYKAELKNRYETVQQNHRRLMQGSAS